MTKKELKQKIAEIFGNSKITTKSHYIRELIEKEVSEDCTIINEDKNIKEIKYLVDLINDRQIKGYETFINVNKNLETINSNILNVWIILLCILITNLARLFIN